MSLIKFMDQQSMSLKNEQITQELKGYWEDDQWEALECPLYTPELNFGTTKIKFNPALNSKVKRELKYYLFNRLTSMELRRQVVEST